MDINAAKQLEVGDDVLFPADRGNPKGVGTVSKVGDGLYTNMNNTEYVWVTLKKGGVWPSNRLSARVF